MRTFIILAFLLLPDSARATNATGQVFLDSNKNGLLDAGERGIAGVRVSNGLDVVTTTDEGRYTLPVDEQSIIFITKPRDYAIPVNAHMLPQFYYIHQPTGSPAGMRYDGIAPTGPLPEQIDFALIERQESEQFEAILFADPQPQTQRELDYIRDDVIAELIDTEAVFGMTLGDILYDDLSMFPRYNALIAQIGIPWYNVPGNHELNFEADGDKYSLETFKKFFGPPYYAFEYADALFVVLDNIDYQGNGEADPGDVRGDGGYEARISKRQLRWLRKELEFVDKDRLVFVATHAPLGSEVTSSVTQNRRVYSNCCLADLTYIPSPVTPIRTTTSISARKTVSTARARSTTTYWQPSPALGGVVPFDERGIAISDQRDELCQWLPHP